MACKIVWNPTKACKRGSLCVAMHDQRAASLGAGALGAGGRAANACTTAATGLKAGRACGAAKTAAAAIGQPTPAGAPAAAALPPASCCISRQGLLLRLRCPGFLPGLDEPNHALRAPFFSFFCFFSFFSFFSFFFFLFSFFSFCRLPLAMR